MVRRLLSVLMLILAFCPWIHGQTKTTVTGNIQDVTGVAATSGYVQFRLRPSSSSVAYRVTGIGVIAPQAAQCTINSSGNLVAIGGSGSCLVWGNTVLSPANSSYDVIFAPNNVVRSTIQQELISGTTYNLANPVFAPNVSLVPQYQSIVTPPLNANLVPSANKAFTLGAAGFYYSTGYIDQLFATNLASSGLRVGLNGATGNFGTITVGNQPGMLAHPGAVVTFGNTVDICGQNAADTHCISEITVETDDSFVLGSTDGFQKRMSFFSSNTNGGYFEFNRNNTAVGTAAPFRIETDLVNTHLFYADPQANGRQGFIGFGAATNGDAFFLSNPAATITSIANDPFYVNWFAPGTITVSSGTAPLIDGVRVDTVTKTGAGAATEVVNFDVRADPTGGVTNIGARFRGTSVFDGRMMFAGTTAAFPALARNGTGLNIVLADGSGTTTGLTAGVFAATSVTLSSGSLTFPAYSGLSGTDTSNVQTGYQEGAWTPTGNGITFSAINVAHYVRVGTKTTVWGSVTWPVTADGGQARINGLPFAANASFFAGPCSLGYYEGAAITGAYMDTNQRLYLLAGVGAIATNAQASAARFDFSCTFWN